MNTYLKASFFGLVLLLIGLLLLSSFETLIPYRSVSDTPSKQEIAYRDWNRGYRNYRPYRYAYYRYPGYTYQRPFHYYRPYYGPYYVFNPYYTNNSYPNGYYPPPYYVQTHVYFTFR